MREVRLVGALGLLAVAGCRQAANARSDTTAMPRAAAPAHSAAHAESTRTTLLGNLGSYHRTISTTVPEAQQFFDEGLTLLYGFNHAEAFRSFARSAALDTLAPMPHWGMALALGTNINDIAPAERLASAHHHLADAQARTAHGSAVERGLVEALAQRYVADPTGDQMVREEAYSNAMRTLSRQFPGDDDVAVLFAESLMNLRPWKLYKADGTPAPETGTIVSTLERVMQRRPDHPGANHYFIHAVEASNHPERGTAAAGRLETLVPGAGHLVHMPAHIYIRTGEYARSARANAVAAAVDEQYFAATRTSGLYSAMYYSHNLQFEAAAAMYAGNMAEARDAARRTVALTDPIADGMVMLEPFAAMNLFVLVRFGQWTDVLAQPAPKPTRLLQVALYHWARGAARAATGNADSAAAELRAMEAAMRALPADVMVGTSNTAAAVATVAAADLRGRVAESRGDWTGAVAAYTAAVSAEDRLGYNEPPDWLLPERERLGAALLHVGDGVRAEAVFRADLARNVGNPRALHGLWQSRVMQHRPDSAQARARFERAWQASDGPVAR